MKKRYRMRKSLPIWGFLLLILCSCQVQEVEINSFNGVRIKRFSGKQIGVDVLMEVNNPNDFGFRITGISLDVSLNGKYVGKVTQAEKTSIPKRSEEVHTLHLNVEMDNWVSGMAGFIRLMGKRETLLEAEGYLKVRSSLISRTIPIHEKTKVSVLP